MKVYASAGGSPLWAKLNNEKTWDANLVNRIHFMLFVFVLVRGNNGFSAAAP